MAGGFSAALVAYGAAYTISPTLVSGIPHWFLTVCTIGSMVCAWLSVVSRGVKQNLPEKPDV